MTATVKHQSWKALESHYQKISKLHLRDLFANDPERGERMSIDAVGLYLDYSKNRVTDETIELLVQLAEGAHEWLGAAHNLLGERVRFILVTS